MNFFYRCLAHPFFGTVKSEIFAGHLIQQTQCFLTEEFGCFAILQEAYQLNQGLLLPSLDLFTDFLQSFIRITRLFCCYCCIIRFGRLGLKLPMYVCIAMAR